MWKIKTENKDVFIFKNYVDIFLSMHLFLFEYVGSCHVKTSN